jgi:hypothetical protein
MSEVSRKDFSFIQTPAGRKSAYQLCGWSGKEKPDVLRSAFDAIGFPRLKIVGAAPITAGTRMMLWEVGRKIIGKDTPNYAQEIGDCVSFGAKNAINYVQYFPMANGERKTFKEVYPPYLYGTGRVFIGKRQLGRGDGSLGVWQAKAVMEYGTIPVDTPNCPSYSGRVAKDWGYNGPPDSLVQVGKTYIVKSAALVQTWEDVIQAVTNGYPVTIASNIGFDMSPRSDGFNHHSTSWAHQMCIIGVDAGDDKVPAHACIINSWGEDAHGTIKDFRTGENWPAGTLRVTPGDVKKILADRDSFAFSAFDGFPAQGLSRDFFDFI